MQKRQAVHKSGAIYQFKVTLKESDPPIWRRIQVPDCTLGELHEVLQVVMDWGNCHLHQFIVTGGALGKPLEDLDMEIEDEEESASARSTPARNTPRIIYEYDFGDSWQHEIVLEKILEPEPNVAYPRCIEGARACPPEDVGGIWGYGDFLVAISDPNHEDHDEMVEWIGGEFDPEKFSVDKVNKELGEHSLRLDFTNYVRFSVPLYSQGRYSGSMGQMSSSSWLIVRMAFTLVASILTPGDIHSFRTAPDRLLRRGSRGLCCLPRHLQAKQRRPFLRLLFRLRACFHAKRPVAKRGAHHGSALLRSWAEMEQAGGGHRHSAGRP